MPCIEKPRKNAKESWSSYCGKMMSVNKPSFKNVEAAYKGDEPICPKCRKVLNLPKKEIKTRITSMKISTIDKLITIYYNNKDNIEQDKHPIFFPACSTFKVCIIIFYNF